MKNLKIRLWNNDRGQRFEMPWANSEIAQLLIAWIVLGLCFSIRPMFGYSFLYRFIISLITVGFGFLGHELAHKFIAIRYGYSAKFQLWTMGLGMALFFAVSTGGGMIFAAPGAVYITQKLRNIYLSNDPQDEHTHNGLISISGPLFNVILALMFFFLSTLNFEILRVVGNYGLVINLWLATFNMVPFPPMDGWKVFRWNKLYWAITAIPLGVIMLSGMIYLG